MALYQKCVHLGCRVPFCQASQWFECPCHGSKYNRAGEYRDGPAPRGMDRFAVIVEGGSVKVDTSQIVLGPPRGTNTINQDPEGPFCINIGGE
jgi:cytochrome b6-f complex iron-sulfur subunit